jgi:hypothetical protein
MPAVVLEELPAARGESRKVGVFGCDGEPDETPPRRLEVAGYVERGDLPAGITVNVVTEEADRIPRGAGTIVGWNGVPALPPFPTPWYRPFHAPSAGSQTSKRMLESGVGRLSPSTRQAGP